MSPNSRRKRVFKLKFWSDFGKVASHLQIQLVEQEAAMADVTVIETILNTDIERKELLEEE